MRPRIGAFLQALVMLLVMCVPAMAMADTAGITLALDRTGAAVGESVTASGTVEPGAWAPLKVIDENGTILVFDAKRADANGNYSIEFKVPPGAVGTLTVAVGEGTNVATADLPVVVRVTGVSIAEGDQELAVGRTVQLTAVVEPENATNKAVTWSSSDEAVATVSETGLVTAVSVGTATIMVRTEEGDYTDSITVAVLRPVYTVTPVDDPAYTIGTTPDGIKTMTVNPGVIGFRHFTVNISSEIPHAGSETAVFTHLRDGMQLELNATRADFDPDGGVARAGFNVQPRDVIKVFIVDELSNAPDHNPMILQ